MSRRNPLSELNLSLGEDHLSQTSSPKRAPSSGSQSSNKQTNPSIGSELPSVTSTLNTAISNNNDNNNNANNLSTTTSPLKLLGSQSSAGGLSTSPMPFRFSTDLNVPTTPRSRLGGNEFMDIGSPLAYPSSEPSSSAPRRSSQLMSTPRSQRSDLRVPGLFDRLQNTGRTSTQETGDSQQSRQGDGIDNVTGDANLLQADPADIRTVIWGTNVNIQESINSFRYFLQSFTMAVKLRALTDDPESLDTRPEDEEPFYPKLFTQMKLEEYYNLNLDCENLKVFPASEKLYYQLIRFPQEIIPVMDFAATEFFMNMFEDLDMQTRGLVVRPYNLGLSVNMRELDPSDIDQLITVKGLLIRTSPILPDMKKGFFRCCVCEQTTVVDIDRGRIQEPTTCPNETCNGRNTMRLIHNRCEFSNKQVARMQETPDETPDGQTPYTVSMYIYDDLVDVAKPGDKLEVTGIFRAVPVKINPRRRAVKAQFKTYLDVVHVKRSSDRRLGVDPSITQSSANKTDYIESDQFQVQDREQEAKFKDLAESPGLYEILSNSIAPSIFGMDDVKKGVLLQLFGGTLKHDESSTRPADKTGLPRIRGDINILIVGDPGLAKSQLLKYVHHIAPRGIYTSGKGSSAVGLTAYITRDPDSNQLVLESGALVLSDGGICCIDEFDKMSESTRSVLHEVMEQQTISIAKAGIITTLNARTSILASANPIRSKFDERLSVVENINIPPPLLSRFDLLYLVLDKPNEQDDRRLAQHILSLYHDESSRIETRNIVPIDFFARYVSYARNNIRPQISESAGACLVDYYVNMRQWGKSGNHHNQNVVTATTRQLESMIRLSQAHAKMRLSATVEPEDVVEAHRLISTAMQKTCIDPLTGKLDLDMITTGISSKQMAIQSDQRKLLIQLINESDSASVRFIDLFNAFNEKLANRKLAEHDFSKLLDDLALEDRFTVRGRSNAEKVVLKK